MYTSNCYMNPVSRVSQAIWFLSPYIERRNKGGALIFKIPKLAPYSKAALIKLFFAKLRRLIDHLRNTKCFQKRPSQKKGS